MTPIVLVDELVKFIQPVVANFDIQTNVKGAPTKSPQVVAFGLKDKVPHDKQNPPDYPFVVVRYLSDNGRTATVRIIAGTYSEDIQDGWRDCMNVIIRIKDALVQQPFIGGVFKVEEDGDSRIETELPEEQPYPEWVATLTVPITIPQMQQEGGYLKNVFE